MIKLIKEKTTKKTRNMEDDFRGIYIGDMLEEIDYELKQEGFNLVYTDECITPKDCKYSKYTDGKFEVIVYYAENDSIIRDIYVNEVVNESYKRSNIQEKIFPDQYQSNIDGKTYTIRWHDDKRQFYVQIPCARKTLWSDDPEDLMGKIDIELKKCYKKESYKRLHEQEEYAEKRGMIRKKKFGETLEFIFDDDAEDYDNAHYYNVRVRLSECDVPSYTRDEIYSGLAYNEKDAERRALNAVKRDFLNQKDNLASRFKKTDIVWHNADVIRVSRDASLEGGIIDMHGSLKNVYFIDDDRNTKKYFESVKPKKVNVRKLTEKDVEIEVKHEGILEVPEGKNVEDLPVSHFVNLAKKKGTGKITKALNNLQVWNKKKNPSLSKWAGDMIDKLNKRMEKKESIFKEGSYGLDYVTDAARYYFNKGYSYDEAEKDMIKRHKNESFIENVLDYMDELFDEDDYYDESLKESSTKSYWRYNLNDPNKIKVEENDDFDEYFDKYSIRKIKLTPCETPEDCYVDEGGWSTWAVCSDDYPYDEIYGTKEEAYDELMYRLNNSIYERRHDL